MSHGRPWSKLDVPSLRLPLHLQTHSSSLIHGQPFYKPASDNFVGAVHSKGPSTEAPTTRRCDAQDQRLLTLEAQVEALEKDEVVFRAEVAEAQDRHHVDLREVKQEVQGFQAMFTQQLQENLNSLRSAQTAQQAQVDQGSAELKAMLQASASPRPAKRHAPDASHVVDGGRDGDCFGFGQWSWCLAWLF